MNGMMVKIQSIKNKDDFVSFLNELAIDFRNNPEEWKNMTVDTFLESVASWVEDYSTAPNNDIEWEKLDYTILARLFYVGKIYE